jgi:hypothetical protein
MEYFMLGSSIHTVTQAEEGREYSGVQSRHYKLGKCNLHQCVRPSGREKVTLTFIIINWKNKIMLM